MPPMGAANPCTAPQAGIGQSQTAAQAGVGHVRTGGRIAGKRPQQGARGPRDASRHRASVSGLARRQVKGSINCVNASMPVAAVMAGGRSWVIAGSTIATAGNMRG